MSVSLSLSAIAVGPAHGNARSPGMKQLNENIPRYQTRPLGWESPCDLADLHTDQQQLLLGLTQLPKVRPLRL